MSHHKVEPTLQAGGYGIDWKFVCTAPVDAFCRAEFACECESVTFERDEKTGLVQHPSQYDPEVMHVQQPGGDCNYINWMHDGYGGTVEECYDGSDGESVRPGFVTFGWNGDGYNWQYEKTEEST